jgi:hypothetical protein
MKVLWHPAFCSVLQLREGVVVGLTSEGVDTLDEDEINMCDDASGAPLAFLVQLLLEHGTNLGITDEAEKLLLRARDNLRRSGR